MPSREEKVEIRRKGRKCWKIEVLLVVEFRQGYSKFRRILNLFQWFPVDRWVKDRVGVRVDERRERMAKRRRSVRNPPGRGEASQMEWPP